MTVKIDGGRKTNAQNKSVERRGAARALQSLCTYSRTTLPKPFQRAGGETRKTNTGPRHCQASGAKPGKAAGKSPSRPVRAKAGSSEMEAPPRSRFELTTPLTTVCNGLGLGLSGQSLRYLVAGHDP